METIDWKHNQVPSLEYFAEVGTTTYVIIGSPFVDAGEGRQMNARTGEYSFTREPAGMVIGWIVLEWDAQRPKVLTEPFFALQGAMDWAEANLHG